MPVRQKWQLLIEADVLIDYLKTDESILALAGHNYGSSRAQKSAEEPQNA